jgi:hypothetical protein
MGAWSLANRRGEPHREKTLRGHDDLQLLSPLTRPSLWRVPVPKPAPAVLFRGVGEPVVSERVVGEAGGFIVSARQIDGADEDVATSVVLARGDVRFDLTTAVSELLAGEFQNSRPPAGEDEGEKELDAGFRLQRSAEEPRFTVAVIHPAADVTLDISSADAIAVSALIGAANDENVGFLDKRFGELDTEQETAREAVERFGEEL